MTMNIERCWKHENEPNKIHYIITDGVRRRHLWEPTDTALGQFLNEGL